MKVIFSNADLVEMVKQRLAADKYFPVKVPCPIKGGEPKYEVLFKQEPDGINAVVEVKLLTDML